MANVHYEVSLANPTAEMRRIQSPQGGRHATFISIESYLAWLPDAEVLQVFKAAAEVPLLRTFRISFSFQRFRQLPVLPIPFQALVTVLKSAQKLETLTLDEVTLGFRDTNDLMALSSTLQSAPALKVVTLFNCFPNNSNGHLPQEAVAAVTATPDSNSYTSTLGKTATSADDSTISKPRSPIEQLAEALVSVPSLNELNLIFTREAPEWISALLKHSCSSKSMTILRINVPDGSFLGDPMKYLCRSLESNSTLRELSIRCPLDSNGGEALAKAIQSTTNRLERLYIQLKNYNYAVPIAEALHTNLYLKSLELRVWTGGDRSGLLAAYETMVLYNPVIRELTVDNGRLGLTPIIDFYLNLNRHDRRRLLEGGDKLTKQVWIDFLVLQQPSLSGLFYTLSLNPTLCQPKEDEHFSVTNEQGRRKRQRVFA